MALFHQEVKLVGNKEEDIKQLNAQIFKWCSEFEDQDPTIFAELVLNNRSPFFLDSTNYHRDIAVSLLENRYWCRNRFEKYYVPAFALDYTRFEVFSKDCEKELISWRPGQDDQAPMVNQITNPDYNENPVISLMKALQ